MKFKKIVSTLAALGLSLGVLSVATASPATADETPFNFNYATVSTTSPRIEVQAFAYQNSTVSLEAFSSTGESLGTTAMTQGPAGLYSASIPVDRSKVGPTFRLTATASASGFTLATVTKVFKNASYEKPIVLPVSIGGHTLSWFVDDYPPLKVSFTPNPSTATSRVELLSSCPGRTNEVLGAKTAKLNPGSTTQFGAFFENIHVKNIGPDFTFRVYATAPGFLPTTKIISFPGKAGGNCNGTVAPKPVALKIQPTTWIKSWGKKSGIARVARTVKITGAARSAAGVKAKTAIKYQWYLNGAPIRGATKSSYKIPTSATVTVNKKATAVSVRSKSLTVRVSSVKSGYKDRYKVHSFGKVR